MEEKETTFWFLYTDGYHGPHGCDEQPIQSATAMPTILLG
jgi:hypothetical protein